MMVGRVYKPRICSLVERHSQGEGKKRLQKDEGDR